MKKILLMFIAICGFTLQAQVLIVDTNSSSQPDANAILELKSNDKGLLLPRIDGDASSLEVEGMMYYDVNGKCFKAYDGTAWQTLGTACELATAYEISIADATPDPVDEGGNHTFVVTVSPAVVAGTTVSVDYTTTDGTAAQPADYTTTNGTLTFSEGQTTQNIVVTTNTDATVDGAVIESYTVELSNASTTGYATASITTASGTGNINDVDTTVLTFTEDLESQTLPGSYSDFTFSGPDGTTWSATHARDDAGYEIGGTNALMLPANNDNLEITLPNGIIAINFDYRKAFTGSGNRGFTVSKLVGTVETTLFTSPSFGGASGRDETIYNTGNINVNETGSVTLIIKNTNGKQFIVDNLTWTR